MRLVRLAKRDRCRGEVQIALYNYDDAYSFTSPSAPALAKKGNDG